MVEAGDIMRVVGTRLGLPASDDERGRKATALAQDVINKVFTRPACARSAGDRFFAAPRPAL